MWKKIAGGLSFTTALFVFQACYGTPQDFGADAYIEGIVKSKTTGLPVKGILVSIPEYQQNLYTDANGFFSLYTVPDESCRIRFEDTDAELNGLFQSKDTLLSVSSGRQGTS
ncbi:MAG: carboxypeptidase-like regulatory domain-containing protein [Marinilabiliales bacterium]|nr:carboxypeptidase-like regulatory domain-containing protein [Marinilabiliales bacterium]